MSSSPKLRIFAGPNGSGKTTLFESIKSTYFSTRLFVNADLLEQDFNNKNFINLSDFEIEADNDVFQVFCSNHGLFEKAHFANNQWNLVIRENVIVKDLREEDTRYNSYHFALIADFLRNQLILSKKSFSFETVFSHPSKLDLIALAQKNNYKVYLYFIGTETPVMNIERVNDRVKKGGHAVEDKKIESRYFLTMDLLFDTIKKVNEAYFWDNSGSRHQYVGSLKKGYIEFEQSNIPDWIYTYILDKVK